jgi:hypothetical protein
VPVVPESAAAATALPTLAEAESATPVTLDPPLPGA